MIDNIFIDLSRNFTINPLINGLSDHDAQLLKLENIIAPIQEFTSRYVRRHEIQKQTKLDQPS